VEEARRRRRHSTPTRPTERFVVVEEGASVPSGHVLGGFGTRGVVLGGKFLVVAAHRRRTHVSSWVEHSASRLPVILALGCSSFSLRACSFCY
jgi:hypothetical protein